MHFRGISAIVFAFSIFVCSPGLIKGQSIDSLLYVIDNDQVKDDSEKYDLLCQVIEDVQDAENKIRYSDQAIELAQKLDILPALPYLKKGEGYLDSGKLVMALECFIQAASFYKKEDSNADLGNAYLLIAETYNKQGNSDNEKLYLQNAIDIFEQERDTFRLAFALHNLGYFNYSIGQYDTAIVVYTKSLDLIQKINHPYANYAYFVWLGNLGLVYSRLSDYTKAEEYILTAIDTLSGFGDERSVTEFMIEHAHILQLKGEIEMAISTASTAFNNTNDPEYERDASRLLTELYKISGRPDSALYYQSIFIVAKDSIENIKSVREMADMRTEFEVAQKQIEVDLLTRQRQNQKIINILVAFAALLIVLLAIGLYRRYVFIKQTNVMINAQRDEIESQRDEVEAQRDLLKTHRDLVVHQKNEIIESINYAERIQSAMLPPESYFPELLKEHFILYKPRDIVSGDFYWIKQVKQYIVLAAADCTGHGIPGAFMSMLGMSNLNEIVQRREITQANEILNELRKQIRYSLRQQGKLDESKDGIDMAISVLDVNSMKLQYAGANIPLYIISDANGATDLQEIKPDRMPLGYYHGKERSFVSHDVKLGKGDTFYMFSDGYVDQKGGKHEKKFLSKNFKKLLFEIYREPMHDQKNILEKTLAEWMGNHSQIDDIMVLGVRV